MGFRESLAINVTPLLLRVGVGVVFIWAGGNKLFQHEEVSGETAATLANLGIIAPPVPLGVPVTPPAATPAPAPSQSPATPPADAPAPSVQPAPATQPPPVAPGGPAARAASLLPVVMLAQATTSPAATPSASPATAPAAAPISTHAQATPAPVVIAPTVVPTYTAADFPVPVRVAQLYMIAPLLHASAQPNEQGKQLWPDRFADPGTIRLLCWLAALTEFFGGVLVLVGLLTRFWSLGLAGTMVVALLLTTIGPATISGNGFLGFLPPTDQHQLWSTMFLQLSMLLMSLGLVFSGPGALAIDRLIFSRASRGPAPDDDSDG